MKVLVACEESQRVCIAFREKGHEAYSCDVEYCSGGHPEWHIRTDVLRVLNGGVFVTEDDELHNIDKWDLIIAHPPCTYLSNSGVCWLYKDVNRWFNLFNGAEFFNKLLNANCKKICVENPIQHKYARALIKPYTQVIQPYMFGHLESKATCLWLKGLKPLKETNNVKVEMLKLPNSLRQRLHYLPPRKNRAKIRSKTFEGIAKAMAEQWG